MPLEMPEKDNTFVLKVSPTPTPQSLRQPQHTLLMGSIAEATVRGVRVRGQQQGRGRERWSGSPRAYTDVEHLART